jgi:hypothetical protein
MENRKNLENLITDFLPETLLTFFWKASGGFCPLDERYRHLLDCKISLEKTWLLEIEEFTRSAKKYGTTNPQLFQSARKKIASLPACIAAIEAKIDERVASLYRVG